MKATEPDLQLPALPQLSLGLRAAVGVAYQINPKTVLRARAPA